MTIRKTTEKDVFLAAEIYEDAKKFMRESGNLTQWADGYPNADSVREDIAAGVSYVCEDGGEVLAVFMYAVCEEPTYRVIHDGKWLNDRPYAVIHRIAVSDKGRGRGIAAFIFAQCFAKYPNLKIDTHEDNIPMQRALSRAGFVRCGKIYLENGEPRLAYHKDK